MLKPHEITNLGRQLARFKNIMTGWQSELPRYEGTIFKVLPFSMTEKMTTAIYVEGCDEVFYLNTNIT